MVKHGILNSKAEYWVHLHPNEYSIYWYARAHMLEWIKEKNLKLVDGRSRDGTITGKGYLAPKNLPFISHVRVPREIIDYFDWDNGTDREKGLLWGEKAIEYCITRKVLTFPIWSASRMRDRAEQFASTDFQLPLRASPRFEVKTEMVESQNLFVQTHELDHKVHLTKDNMVKFTRAEGLN